MRSFGKSGRCETMLWQHAALLRCGKATLFGAQAHLGNARLRMGDTRRYSSKAWQISASRRSGTVRSASQSCPVAGQGEVPRRRVKVMRRRIEAFRRLGMAKQCATLAQVCSVRHWQGRVGLGQGMSMHGATRAERVEAQLWRGSVWLRNAQAMRGSS